MPRKAIPVKGVSSVKGSGIWYVRFKINGKLVRKSSGRNRAAAITHVKKARTLISKQQSCIWRLIGDRINRSHEGCAKKWGAYRPDRPGEDCQRG